MNDSTTGATSGDTHLTCVTHVPFVSLEGAEPVPVLGGQLAHLDFETWYRLDNNFPFAERDYQRARPLFYVQDRTAPSDLDLETAAGEFSMGPARILHEALMLVTLEPIFSPSLSMTYCRREETGAYVRIAGPLEREVLLYAHESRLILSEEDIERIRQASAFLADTRPKVLAPEVEAGFACLERTSRVEFTALVAIVQQVIALEALLMPECRMDLADTFARRSAIVLSRTAEGLSEARTQARGWYRVRSEGLHGLVPGRGDDVEADTAGLSFDVRRGLATALVMTLTYLTAGAGTDLIAFRAELDAAWSDPSGLAEFRRRCGVSE